MKQLLTLAFLFSLLLPVTGQEEKNPISNEIVLFTLLDENLRYEIRLFQNKNIKTYELKNGQETFLGKFMSLGEVESSEPYKKLIGEIRKSSKAFVTDGYLGNDFYEIYIHNLFNAKTENPIFVEVLKIQDKKSKVVSRYEKEADFNQSPFAPLLFRD